MSKMEPITLTILLENTQASLEAIFDCKEGEAQLGLTYIPLSDVTVTLDDMISVKGIHDAVSSSLLEISLTLAGNISINLVSSWLYDALNRSKVKRISIEETEITVDIDEINKALRMNISKSSKVKE